MSRQSKKFTRSEIARELVRCRWEKPEAHVEARKRILIIRPWLSSRPWHELTTEEQQARIQAMLRGRRAKLAARSDQNSAETAAKESPETTD
jgi:hypothetical protein